MDQPLNENEVREGKFFALIGYISFLCIIGLVLKKDNKFALFHAKQGLVLFVIEVVSFILSAIPVLVPLLRIGLAVIILASLWGMLQAYAGRFGRIPVVSEIAEKIIL